METITGIIKKIKQDRKALLLDEVWYNSFKPIEESIKQDDEVSIIYSVKGDFNNIRSIQKLDKQPTKQIKQIMTKEALGLDKEEIKEKIPNQTINTILMNVKDILNKEIEKGYKFTPEELIIKSEILTKMFVQDYKIILANI